MRASEEVTFGATAIDRAAHLRADVNAMFQQDEARTLVLWSGKPLVQNGELMRLPTDHFLTKLSNRTPLFLGLEDGKPLFAFDISSWEPEDIDADAMKQFFDASANHHPDMPDDAVFQELRGIMVQLSPEDANLAATARGIFAWHDTHPHCARCGAKSFITQAGWQRDCPACSASHFPRTDPVVIVLALHGNNVLLGRSHNWPEGMYSLLAGFMEPGETIEAASRREVFEESGIRLGHITYLSSQPWPYPSSLMFGTMGHAENTDITIDPIEIQDAKWVSREDVLAAMTNDNPDLRPARPGSIARFLLDRWVSDDLD